MSMTREGVVSCVPSPVQAIWRELDARYSALMSDTSNVALKGECHGLAVAVSIVHCIPISEVTQKAHTRYLDSQTQPV